LIGHFDPRIVEVPDYLISKKFPKFVEARSEAQQSYHNYTSRIRQRSFNSIQSISDIKEYLQRGIPVVVDLDLFYGAWNLPQSAGWGGRVDYLQLMKGVVSYPEKGSLDLKNSKLEEHRAGHSVLVVGYDDEVEVRSIMTMEDGIEKEFVYKGVYYFKNSWGTYYLGNEFSLNGK